MDKTFNNEHYYTICLSCLQRRRVVLTNDRQVSCVYYSRLAWKWAERPLQGFHWIHIVSEVDFAHNIDCHSHVPWGIEKITPDQIYQFCKFCEDRSVIDREIFNLAEITKKSIKHKPSSWLTNIYLAHGRTPFYCYPLIFAVTLWLQQRRHFPVDLGLHTVANRVRVYRISASSSPVAWWA